MSAYTHRAVKTLRLTSRYDILGLKHGGCICISSILYGDNINQGKYSDRESSYDIAQDSWTRKKWSRLHRCILGRRAIIETGDLSKLNFREGAR